LRTDQHGCAQRLCSAYHPELLRRSPCGAAQEADSLSLLCHAIQRRHRQLRTGGDSPLTFIEFGPSGGVAGAARIGWGSRRNGYPVPGRRRHDRKMLPDQAWSTQSTALRRRETHLVIPFRFRSLISWRLVPAEARLPGSIRATGLRVGPHGAGATPGPACYCRGGVDPTVADAKLALGILDRLTFAEGRMQLDVKRARSAIACVSAPMKLSARRLRWRSSRSPRKA
jgi:hypothetical protein